MVANKVYKRRSRRLEQQLQTSAASREFKSLWRRDTNFLLVDLFDAVSDLAGIGGLVECGAHAAETSRRFVASRSDRVALAIEANPYTYRAKTLDAARMGVTVLNVGLASRRGRLTLRIPRDPLSSELIPGNASFLERTSVADYDDVDVDVTTVDSLVADHLEGRSFALWIDVEGQNREVLAGASASLQSSLCRVVFIEVEEDEYWKGQALADEVVNTVIRHGLVPIARDAEFLHQYNVLFVRQDLALEAETYIADYWRAASRSSLLSRARFWKRAFRIHGYGKCLRSVLLRKLIGAERYLQLWERRHGS